MTFFVETGITEELCSAVAALDPANPGYTWPYVKATANAGSKPVLIGIREAGTMVCGCPAFVRAGKLNRSLQLRSLPRVPSGCEFWEGLISYCRREGFHRVSIETFGSASAEIPALQGETSRYKRWEFVLDLKQSDLTLGMGKEHRRLIRRAPGHGIEFQRTRESSSLQEHQRVCGASLDRRRERGEGVQEAGTDLPRALLSSGVAEVFQAVLKGRVVSSGVVIKSAKGAYLYSAGTDPEGMQLGASHYLIFRTAQALQLEGIEQYNLGGTRDLESGLAFYKSRFGARVIPLESVELYLGGRLRKMLSAAASFLATDAMKLSKEWFRKFQPLKHPAPGLEHSTHMDRTSKGNGHGERPSSGQGTIASPQGRTEGP